MEKTTQEQIKAKLRAKIAEWTAEETEHWFSGSARNEGDLNDYLETLDMVVTPNVIHFYLWDQGGWKSCDWQ